MNRPESPRHFCEINYSTIGEKAENIANSPKLIRSKRDQMRLKWINLSIRFRKFRDMQSVFSYLKDASYTTQIKKNKRIEVFKKFRIKYLRRKWKAFSTKLVEIDRSELFSIKAKRVREIRANQVTAFIMQHPQYQPNIRFLLSKTPSMSCEPVQRLRGEGEMNVVEERNVNANNKSGKKWRSQKSNNEDAIDKDEMKKPLFLRKEAIILYLFVLIFGIIAGWGIYRKNNKSLYYYLYQSKLRIKNQIEIPNENETILTNLTGPKQDLLLLLAPKEDINETYNGTLNGSVNSTVNLNETNKQPLNNTYLNSYFNAAINLTVNSTNNATDQS